METISVSSLKTHLSAELRRIEAGAELTVMDHKRPVARLVPVSEVPWVARSASARYVPAPLPPLIGRVSDELLAAEREDSW